MFKTAIAASVAAAANAWGTQNFGGYGELDTGYASSKIDARGDYTGSYDHGRGQVYGRGQSYGHGHAQSHGSGRSHGGYGRSARGYGTGYSSVSKGLDKKIGSYGAGLSSKSKGFGFGLDSKFDSGFGDSFSGKSAGSRSFSGANFGIGRSGHGSKSYNKYGPFSYRKPHVDY